jgi:hypothetical protein
VSLGTLEPRQRPDDAKLSAVPVERCGALESTAKTPDVWGIEKNPFKPDDAGI